MSSTPKFAHCDTKKPDGFYVQFERVIEVETIPRPDEHDEGFWPSHDPEAAGYVLPEDFADQQRQAEQRMADWNYGRWSYVGVRARAKCLLVQNHTGTYVNLDSAGVWGVESDAGSYLDELYQEQIEELKGMIEAMRNPVYEP